ncbi:MAG: hypothetical protein KC619_22045 [Myxococcales bacterium]|nr:hypothetical protein [Myxococcales bacterium]
MPSSFIQSLIAVGLATLGTIGIAAGPSIGEIAPASSAPEMVTVAPEVAAASQIDPALLNNPTLRRAIAQVGPDLVRDPAVREAIRTGHADASLMQNPAVSRAMIQVGPSLLADPTLAAAIRSGELSPSLLSDPAVLSILRGLDPTLVDEAPEVMQTAIDTSTPAAPVTRPAVRPTRGQAASHDDADDEDEAEHEHANAEREDDDHGERRGAENREAARERVAAHREEVTERQAPRREAVESHRTARRAQRGPVQAPNGVSSENRAQLRNEMQNAAQGLIGMALGIAQEMANR